MARRRPRPVLSSAARRRWAALLVGLGAIPLAACRADVRVQVALGRAGSGTVSARVALDRPAAAAVGVLDVRDLRRDGWLVVGPVPSPDGSENLTVSHAFRTTAEAAILLGRLGPPLQLHVTHHHGPTSSSVGVGGVIDLRAGLDALAGAQGALPGGLAAAAAAVAHAGGTAPSVSAQVVADFPGRPTGVVGGGRVTGDTVTWDVPLGSSVAVGAASGRTDAAAVHWFEAAAGLLVALVIVVVVEAVLAAGRPAAGVGVTPPL